jgi:hypothetical protein
LSLKSPVWIDTHRFFVLHHTQFVSVGHSSIRGTNQRNIQGLHVIEQFGSSQDFPFDFNTVDKFLVAPAEASLLRSNPYRPWLRRSRFNWGKVVINIHIVIFWNTP